MEMQVLNDMTEVLRACRTETDSPAEQVAMLAERAARAERVAAKRQADNDHLQGLYQAASRRAARECKRANVAEQCQEAAEKALFYWRFATVAMVLALALLIGAYMVALSDVSYWQTKAENPGTHAAASSITYDYDMQKAVVWYK